MSRSDVMSANRKAGGGAGLYTGHVQQDVDRILISRDQIARRIEEMGRAISRDLADISGDGLIDQIDMSFVIQNYLEHDKDACCPDGRGGAPAAPVTRISIIDLEAMGLGRLRSADLNQDGLLDADDIAAFLKGRMPLARE